MKMKRRTFLKGAAGAGLCLVATGIDLGHTGASAPQYAMIIDLDRCMGCESCSVVCRLERNSPPNCFFTRLDTHEVGRYPDSRLVFVPVQCNQCSQAPCIKVCPTHAIRRTKEGIVVTDWDICDGTGACIAACPTGMRFADHRFGNRSDKCDFCIDLVREDRLPLCVETCPSHARLFGDLAAPEGEFAEYVRQRRLFQFPAISGTQGRVFYAGSRRLAEGVKV